MEDEPSLVTQPEIKPTYDSLKRHVTDTVTRQLTGTGNLSQDGIMKVLIAEFSDTEAGLKLNADYTTEAASFMRNRITESLGLDYKNLLVDPSISTRLDEFIAFAKPLMLTNSKIDPLTLRELFQKNLCKKKVYRGALLNKTEYENIKQEGFKAGVLRSDKSTPDVIAQQALLQLSNSLHMHDGFANTGYSGYISVSEFPGMALYASSIGYKGKLEEIMSADRKLYLFPIELDEFDLIRYGWYLTRGVAPTGIFKTDTEQIAQVHPGIEAFIPLQIPAEHINFHEIQTVEAEEIPRYEWILQNMQNQFSDLPSNIEAQIKSFGRQSRYVQIPQLGVVDLIGVPNLTMITNQDLWVGSTSQHPNAIHWRHPSMKIQPVYVDMNYAYDKTHVYEAIEKKLRKNDMSV